ncbi:hypothetical protein BTO30_07005 [Domibacillus antri]|uniref:Uncharacterized protein n=1 Tax=Domibacillus antri TaxID=1714264 RepID=A0A1Q8Q6G7_9BACI|nr:hypothetical protein [Domibacillus antri]OLN22937.1 hypothetical protein BTO30_07005 [Domibacillus antri]
MGYPNEAVLDGLGFGSGSKLLVILFIILIIGGAYFAGRRSVVNQESFDGGYGGYYGYDGYDDGYTGYGNTYGGSDFY